jgi:hypothetical protein
MKTGRLRRKAGLVFAMLVASQSASAATIAGSSALALASLVAVHSPALSRHQKNVMAHLFGGHSNVALPAGRRIYLIKVDAIVCRAGNVDITARSCRLTFGAVSTNLTGRMAHELYATIVEAGVSSEGAAGSIFESLSHLVCTIDPGEIAQRSGGGADCTFDLGAPG